ncbi:DUF5011 domain-containing protein [Patescibacteria group bacterium]|nr:DUF5011 domain-containing protein [Patescibacteria group bacterium]
MRTTFEARKGIALALYGLGLFSFSFVMAFTVAFVTDTQEVLATGGTDEEKITICHATGSDTNPWNTLHVSENSTGGHFDEQGTPEAGHESDLLLSGHVDCPQIETLGSISVCKTIIDEHGNIVDGASVSGSFEISGRTGPGEVGTLPTSNFATPLSFNADVFNSAPGDNGDDAQCVTYSDLTLGGYYYDEEVIVGVGWETPLYNDQFSIDVTSVGDFFVYNFDGPDNNVDGHIVLTNNRPNRTLIVLNQIKDVVPPPPPPPSAPSCSLATGNDITIVNFPSGKIRSDQTLSNATAGPVSTSLPAGSYEVSLMAWDGYTNRVNTSQPKETYFARLGFNGASVVDSSPTSDLTDNVVEATFSGVVDSSLVLPTIVNEVTAYHEVYPDTSNANSVVPICASFKLLEEPEEKFTISASKIVCEDETSLPNFGGGGPDITSTTATDFVNTHSGCLLEDGWSFQWGDQSVTNPGDNTGAASGGWTTFGPTDNNGVIETEIVGLDLNSVERIWVREVFQSDYIPFTHGGDKSNVSAEMYCSADVLNYDNFDFIKPVVADETYYCVAFNVLEQTPENQKPVITLRGSTTVEVLLNGTYNEESADVDDPEDGDIDNKLVIDAIALNVNVVGTYFITYNATDTANLAADTATRTVKVIDSPPPPPPPPPPVCTSNCGGGGGGGPISHPLTIFNEKVIVISEGAAIITWETNRPSDSRVVYDLESHTVGQLILNTGIGPLNLDYDFSTTGNPDTVTKHSILVTSIELENIHYFRPMSVEKNVRVIGVELNALIGGSCGQYLFEFIKINDANNPEEVRKLQIFLNDFEEFNLDVTGVYDRVTYDAVVEFQNKYGNDVLSPWGLESDTGYVYLTTRKKINEIYCRFEISFPLTLDQQTEVEAFKALLESLEAQGLPLPATGGVGLAPPPPAETGPSFVDTGAPEELAVGDIPSLDGDDDEELTELAEGEETVDPNSLASAIEAAQNIGGGRIEAFFNRIGDLLKRVFRR